MNDDELLQRLEALEAREEIRELKHRYLACCDGKDPAGFRACFVDGKVDIDYGAVGQFDNADDLVKIFEQQACHPHMLEWHFSSNPCIRLLGADRAEGHWGLHYQLINSSEGTLTQLGGAYRDEYRRTESGWRILSTHFSPRSCLILTLDQGQAVQTTYAGPPQGLG